MVYERSAIDSSTTGTAHAVAARPWSTITVRLVGSHPLWGHYLLRGTHASYERNLLSDCVTHRWNAARALARYLERTPTLYRGLNVLELGAGAGLPGLVVAKSGARTVRILPPPPLPRRSRVN